MGIPKLFSNAGKWAKNVLSKWGKKGDNAKAEAPVAEPGKTSPPSKSPGDGRVLLERHRANGKFSSHRVDNKQRIDGVRVRDLQPTRR